MDLQVCHCGWSSVTTYHGLRVHQGKKGCTPKGVKVEPHQQHMREYAGLTNVQMEVKLDVRTSFKTENKDYYSDLSLQVCHCGWTKMTTFQGLRIHQGKGGCTSRGMKIPKNEKYDWKHHREEDRMKYRPERRGIVKEEKPSGPPRTSSSRAPTTGRVKEERPSPAWSALPLPSRGASASTFSTLPQVSRTTKQPPVPAHQGTVVPVRKKKIPLQEKTDSDICYDLAATVARIKKEPKSPFAAPERSLRRAAVLKSYEQLQDVPDVQVEQIRLIRRDQVERSHWETPTTPVTRPKERSRRDQALSQVRGLVGELPPVRFQYAAVQPEEHEGDPEPSQVDSSVRKHPSTPPLVPKKYNTGSEFQFLREIQNYSQRTNQIRKEEEYSSLPEKKTAWEDDPVSPIFGSPTTAPVMEENKSPSPPQHSSTKAGLPLQDSSAAEKVNTAAREHPSTPPAVPPKNKNSLLCTAEQEHPASPPVVPVVPFKKSHSSPFISKQRRSESPLVHEAQNYSQRERKMTEEKRSGIGAAEQSRACESVKRTNKPTAAQQEEHPSFSCEAAEADVSTGMKVTELVQMFSVQETASRPKKEDREEHKLSESVTSTRSTSTQTASAEEEVPQMEDPSSVFRSSRPEFSVGTKVKELALRFSVHKAAAPSIEGTREERTISQILSDSANAATKVTRVSSKTTEEELNSSRETKPYPGSSTRLRVKDLARMFSANTIQEKSVGPKDKLGEGKPAHMVKLLVQKLSATTSRDTLHPKQKDKRDQDLSKWM